jgi:hypothetical protein
MDRRLKRIGMLIFDGADLLDLRARRRLSSPPPGTSSGPAAPTACSMKSNCSQSTAE